MEVHLPLPDSIRGRFETNQLCHPRRTTTIKFNVTSLDVIHSFWAYQLGVKADANPDYNNVAYATTQQLGTFIVRCSELCGIWHGAMYNSGRVVTPQQFVSWARLTAFHLRHNTALLPPYRLTYTPDANGADGGYYPDNVDPYSNVETYGAPQAEGQRVTWRPRPGGEGVLRQGRAAVAIDTTPLGEVEYPGEEGVGAPPRPPAGWRRSQWLRPNIIWAIVGAVVGYLIGHWLGNVIAGGYLQTVGASDENDVAVVLGLVLGVTGWMAGIGGLNYPLAKVLGYELSPSPPQTSWVRYFRMTDDHKVVGWQYAVGVLLFLFTGGLLAMLIRTELLSPTSHVFGPGTYIAIVSEHGTMMMMMASSAVVGTLGNGLVPLMIGARRMAYPRAPSPSRSGSSWRGYLVIVSALFFGGFPTGWTWLRRSAVDAGIPARHGFVPGRVCRDRHRHDPRRLQPRCHHRQLPGAGHDLGQASSSSCGASSPRPPCSPWRPRHLVVAGLFGILDRTWPRPRSSSPSTAAVISLWAEPLLVLRPPRGVHHGPARAGIVMDDRAGLLRANRLLAYKVAAAGMLGVALLSFFVWQHHILQSGINPDMRPLFMLTTELISIPTGFLFLVTLGTLWKAKIRFDTPMLFCLGMLFNFLIGGVTGVFLSDVPVNDPAPQLLRDGALPLHDHGRPHLRHVRCLLLLVPEDHREDDEPQAEQVALLDLLRLLQPHVLPVVPRRHPGLGQRRVFEARREPAETLNDISGISAYLLGASFFFFIVNFIWSIYLNPHPAPTPNPWNSLGLEWQTPTPVPWFNFEHIPIVTNDPYHYGEPDRRSLVAGPRETDVGRGCSGRLGHPRRAQHRRRRRRRPPAPDAVRR